MRPAADGQQAIDRALGPVAAFLRVIWALDHALTRSSKRMQRELGITGTQRFVLRLAAQRPGISAGELARALHLDPSTLTGVLSRLESRGLMDRLADAHDGRRALFEASAAGRALAATRARTVETGVRKALRRLSAGEVSTTVRALNVLVEALDEEHREAPKVERPGRARGRGVGVVSRSGDRG